MPSRGGFDFDDATLLLGPAIWFGLLAPLLIGAALGGTAMLLYLSSRLAGWSGRRVAPVLASVRSAPVAREPMRRGQAARGWLPASAMAAIMRRSRRGEDDPCFKEKSRG